MLKRCFDFFVSGFGLVAIAPIFLTIALLVKVSDNGPVFYRQERVGFKGRPFRIWKFRSMRVDAERIGLSITKSGDPRITRIGRFLRGTKLDELPQLFNVFVGEMSMVGPRPEVAKYVTLYTQVQRRVLEFKPGITDIASIEFRNEEQLLAEAAMPEEFYVKKCVPKKIELNLQYAATATMASDILVLFRTFFAIIRRSPGG